MLGYIHVYTGNAKGKTTCAVGLGVRALGAGMRVAFVQFDKGFDGANEHYHERHILRSLDGMTVLPFGLERMMPDGKFRFQNGPEDLAEAAAGMEKARELIIGSGPTPTGGAAGYDMIILDEVVTSTGTGLIAREAVMELVELHREHSRSELILTGRGAWPELIEAVDLVTEMSLVKHYFYEHKAPARPGIDY